MNPGLPGSVVTIWVSGVGYTSPPGVDGRPATLPLARPVLPVSIDLGRPQQAASQLLELQRSDGGWGQIPPLASDAYATGQTLVALRESEIIAPGDAQYQRGVRYLVNSQLEDGSWLVRTRFALVPAVLSERFSARLRSIHLGRGEQLGGDGAVASGGDGRGPLAGCVVRQAFLRMDLQNGYPARSANIWAIS